MKSVNLKLLGALLFLFLAPSAFAQNLEAEKTLLASGQALLQQGNFANAVVEFDKAVKLNSKSVAALYLRGTARFLNQDVEGAVLDASKAIDLAPKMQGIEMVYNLRASLYFFKKDNEKSFADYDKAIAVNPGYADPYNGRGNIFYNKHRFVESLADYDKAIALNPKMSAAYIGRADVEFIGGKFDAAIADLDKSLELTPNIAGAHIKRGIIYGLKENWLSALTNLKKGAEINAQSRSPYWGNVQTTLTEFDEFILSNTQNANAYAVRGFINLLRGKQIESERDFKKSFDIDPKLSGKLDVFIKEIKETN